MSKAILWLERLVALALAMGMAMPAVCATDPLPSAPVPHTSPEVQSSVPGSNQATQANQGQNSPTGEQRPADQQNQKQPAGTAVAPVITPEGAPASRPAGAAIAPMKQRRTRSFVIRTALIVGAVVAVGAVAGASLASPSHAH